MSDVDSGSDGAMGEAQAASAATNAAPAMTAGGNGSAYVAPTAVPFPTTLPEVAPKPTLTQLLAQKDIAIASLNQQLAALLQRVVKVEGAVEDVDKRLSMTEAWLK